MFFTIVRPHDAPTDLFAFLVQSTNEETKYLSDGNKLVATVRFDLQLGKEDVLQFLTQLDQFQENEEIHFATAIECAFLAGIKDAKSGIVQAPKFNLEVHVLVGRHMPPASKKFFQGIVIRWDSVFGCEQLTPLLYDAYRLGQRTASKIT